MLKHWIWMGVIGLVVTPALAQEADYYIDDRSAPVSVLMSYYNAINRHEYARAWAYWGDGHNAQSYDDFVSGYADTENVALLTGEELSEGAAGSVYHTVAVAIEATGADGNVAAYAGCFTLRLVQPAIQEPAFEPLHIEQADLKPVEGAAADNVPESCLDMQSEVE